MQALKLSTQLRTHIALAVIAFMALPSGLLTLRAWGQSDVGSISGTITDPSGAVISGVQVSTTQSSTGVSYNGSTTDGRGEYRIINLPVGTYALSFKQHGFKQYDRNGITLLAAQNATVNVKLQVGGTTEIVTVTSDAPLTDITTGTESTSVSGTAIVELPLSIAGGRNAISFANMAVPTVGGGMVANSQTSSTNIMIDGVDADAGIQGFTLPPGVESVQEVEVQTSGIDAESAQTGGGTFQYELKSGTNQLHGSVFGFLTNEALDANSWADKYWLGYCAVSGAGSSAQCPTDYTRQYRRPNDRLKDWGFSSGGPIWKQHTFIFGAYERYNQDTMASTPNGSTVPTAKMLNGDFSELLTYSGIPGANPACTAGVPCPTGQVDAAGNTIYYGAIFDPSNPGYVFPGNIIPSGRISNQSQKVINIYKTHYAPINDQLVDNFWGFNGSQTTNQNLDFKLDHHISINNNASASLNYAKQSGLSRGNHTGGDLWEKGSTDGGPFADSVINAFQNATIHLTDAYAIKPTLVNNFIIAFNWNKDSQDADSPAGGQFGNSNDPEFPFLQWQASLGSYQDNIGQDTNAYDAWWQTRVKDTLSWVHGKHTMKFGAEYITYIALDNSPGGLTTYGFSGLTGESQALANGNLARDLGSSIANMELGAVYTATAGVTQAHHSSRKAFDAFAADQIKLTNKLSLTLALRWDLNGRLHEKNGDWSNWNPTAQNASWPGLLGDYQYLANSSQSFETNEDYHLLSPHVGAAYQLSHKLVLRGAWGLFYVPMGSNMYGGVPYESCFQCFGANQVAPAASDNVPAFQWDQNIYPGIVIPAAKNPNANDGGWGVATYVTPDHLKLGQSQNWNVGIQYELNKDTMLDIRYMGNIGYGLQDPSLFPLNYPTFSQIHPLVMSGHVNDWIGSQADAQAAGVPWYPFIDTMLGGWGGYSPADAVAPFPQVTAWGPLLAVGYPHGNSSFKGLVAEVTKRQSNGLSMDMSYTFSKAEGNTTNLYNQLNGGNMADQWIASSEFQDPYAYGNFKHMIASSDMRHLVKGYVTYDLPFGRKGRWLQQSRALDYLVGGWTTSGNLLYASGMPMTAVHAQNGWDNWSQLFTNVSTAPGALSNHFKRLDLANLADPSNQFFNPASFTDQSLDQNGPLYGTLGNQNPYYSNWRGWANYNENLAILKHFGVGQDSRFKVTIRAEFFDLLNRHHYGVPSYWSATSPYFGNVTSVSGNRTGQVGARFTW